MLSMIRQFTYKPKEILQPTLWLFLSQACSMLPGNSGLHGYLHLGEGVLPPYTLNFTRLITLAALGVGCFVLQYIVELISYYFTYGKAYRDTADKRIAYIQKLRRQPLGFFSSKESGELISSFSNDFANVEYVLCYWLPYPLGVGALLVISIVWICVYDWRMGLAMFGMLPVCALLMLLIARVKEKHSSRVMEAKAHAATQINEYLRGMKDLKAYHRTGEGFDALRKAMGNLRDESLKDEAVAGSLSNLCASPGAVHRAGNRGGGDVPASGWKPWHIGFRRLSCFSHQTGGGRTDVGGQHLGSPWDGALRPAAGCGHDHPGAHGEVEIQHGGCICV